MSTPYKPIFENLTVPLSNIREQDVDIWQFNLANEPNHFEHILNKNEIERANRFHFPVHRRRHIAAHTTVRKILGLYLQMAPENIEFEQNKYGKPQIKAKSTIHFNLSHSKDLALLAVNHNHTIGIDLEYFSNRPYEGIGSHIFSEFENQALQKLTPFLKPMGFFHLWSQKEALIKACGLGLSYPTKQLTLPVLPKTHEIFFDELHQTNWKILSFMPVPACMAAICYHPSKKHIRYKKLKDINSI